MKSDNNDFYKIELYSPSNFKDKSQVLILLNNEKNI